MPPIHRNSAGLQPGYQQDQLVSIALLELEFGGEALYQYFGVSAQTYQELLLAESKVSIPIPTFVIAWPTPRSTRRSRNPGCGASRTSQPSTG